jgi:Na+/melibiose symporter-like transporter
MRIWTVFIPLVFFGLAMLFLARFPLTRPRMHEIHALLDVRRRDTTGVQRHHSPLKSRDTPESVRE